MGAWLGLHQALFWWLGAVSALFFVASLMLVPWLIVRLPPDFFAHAERPRRHWAVLHPALRAVYIVAKNLLGYVLVLCGILMLVLPGQGILTIIVGIMFLDLPGKFRIERWIALRPRVWRSINALRHFAGRPPLTLGPEPHLWDSL